MPAFVSFCPGAVTKATDIDLPAGSPSIRRIIDGTLFRGSDGTAAAAEVAVVVTKVDRDTIQLDADTQTLDILVVQYETEYETLSVP